MYRWKNLPDHIVGSDIMIMLGMNNLEDLHRCRQVCRSWNLMIEKITKQKKDTMKTRVEILEAEIKSCPYMRILPPVTTAVSLAHHKLLGSLENMGLSFVDLALVPTEHLVALTSCVTEKLFISKIKHCDIISILDSVKCRWLSISDQSLSSEETGALVRAMESRVEWISFGWAGDVILDMTVLTQYSGQGRCERVICDKVFVARFKEEIRSWAQRINSRIIESVYEFNISMTLYMKRG